MQKVNLKKYTKSATRGRAPSRCACARRHFLSVLGPLLFVTYMNDLDDGVENWRSKYADDTKIGGAVDNEVDFQSLQRDLGHLEEWAERWQMEFNADKCEVQHLGRPNQNRTYMVNGRELRNAVEQRDLGMTVHSSLKVNRT